MGQRPGEFATRRVERACNEAVAAGVDGATVAQGRAEVLRIHAHDELLQALQSGDVARMELACGTAEEVDVDASLVAQGR